MIKTEPRMDVKQIFAGLFAAMGMLLFLVVIHLLAITKTGDTQTVLQGVFTTFLWIYVALIIFGFSYVIIHFLKWLVWSISTPTWLKEKQKLKYDANKRNIF